MLTIANHFQSGCITAPSVATKTTIKLPSGETVFAWVHRDGTVGIYGQTTGQIEILPTMAAATNYAIRDREGKPPKRLMYEYGGYTVTFTGCVFADAPAHIRSQWCRDDQGNYLVSETDYIWYAEMGAEWDSDPDIKEMARKFRAAVDLDNSTDDAWEVF